MFKKKGTTQSVLKCIANTCDAINFVFAKLLNQHGTLWSATTSSIIIQNVPTKLETHMSRTCVIHFCMSKTMAIHHEACNYIDDLNCDGNCNMPIQ